MTLKEIAKEAGVSISTVSRVLNQPRAPACFTAHPGYAVYLRINCLFPRGGTG